MSTSASTDALDVVSSQPGQTVQTGPSMQDSGAAWIANSGEVAGQSAIQKLGQDLDEGLDLRDIHLPAEPGFWPPAPGWWLLFAMILALAFWLGRSGWNLYRRLRRRERILGELERLQSAGLQAPALIAAVSALLKRVALSRYPRTEVAALTGEAWLAFLDRSGGNGRFAEGPGRALAQGAYAPSFQQGGQDFDARALIAVVRDWLRRNS